MSAKGRLQTSLMQCVSSVSVGLRLSIEALAGDRHLSAELVAKIVHLCPWPKPEMLDPRLVHEFGEFHSPEVSLGPNQSSASHLPVEYV